MSDHEDHHERMPALGQPPEGQDTLPEPDFANEHEQTAVDRDVITGADRPGIIHAGTARRASDGALLSAGGRVLCGTATGPDLAAGEDSPQWHARIAAETPNAHPLAAVEPMDDPLASFAGDIQL